MAGACAMNAAVMMQSHAENYLSERRRLGYQLRGTGYAVMSFARHLDSTGHVGPVSIETMSSWARLTRAKQPSPTTWARRLKLLRPFARYLQQFEPLTEVPDHTVIGSVGRRLSPHIFTEQEVIDLLAAVRQLQPALRGATYHTLFGLLASTGLRISEALHLTNTDVDLRHGVLIIRKTKFAKSRQVVLHPSAVQALRRYQRVRDHHVVNIGEAPFFVSSRGRRCGAALSHRNVHRIFKAMLEHLGWVNRGAHANPRIHDLRHTFVVRRLVLWHQQGVDIDQAMLSLSTYIGHAKITNTYWYLTGVPELVAIATEKFQPPSTEQEVRHG